jgi:hypothetical protein
MVKLTKYRDLRQQRFEQYAAGVWWSSIKADAGQGRIPAWCWQ